MQVAAAQVVLAVTVVMMGVVLLAELRADEMVEAMLAEAGAAVMLVQGTAVAMAWRRW